MRYFSPIHSAPNVLLRKLYLSFILFLIIGILIPSNRMQAQGSNTDSMNAETNSNDGKLVVEELKGSVNTKFQEFSPSLSPNGNVLYFYSKRDNRNYTDIFSSQRKPDNTWDFPQEVDPVNSEYDDQSPFVTADGKMLFFSSNRDGSYETRLPSGKVGVSRDIYYSEWENGSWGKPKTLPPEINSDMIEENPHFHNGVLLFTRYPFARPDLAKIYMSRKTKEGWTQAKMVGKPVNEKQATIAAAFSHDMKTIFFASNRPGGFGGFDLYSCDWDGNKNIPKGKAENLGQQFNTPGDEAYFSYHRDTKTILFARREEDKSFNIFSAYIPMKKSIEKELEENKKLSLDTIHFDSGSSELQPQSKKPLDKIYEYLAKNKNTKMKIIGHTDLHGNPKDNLVLSKDRSQSVKNYLVKKGIQKNRLSTDGKGSQEPLFPYKDESSSAKNRRTEFQIIE